jgi:hypothetical protein
MSAVLAVISAKRPGPDCGGELQAFGPNALFSTGRWRCGGATAKRSPSPNREGAKT